MKLFFVGVDRKTADYDYSRLDAALRLLQGRRVSSRIWLCMVNGNRDDHIFALLRQCVAADDEMLIREVPDDMHLPDILRMAA